MESYFIAVFLERFDGVFPSKKVKKFFVRSMKEIVAIMPVQSLLWPKLFFMVYGAEAVLPSDIRHDSPRVAAYDEMDNEQARQDALDLLDEQRDVAAARSAIYQQDLRHYHSHRVKSRVF